MQHASKHSGVFKDVASLPFEHFLTNLYSLRSGSRAALTISRNEARDRCVDILVAIVTRIYADIREEDPSTSVTKSQDLVLRIVSLLIKFLRNSGVTVTRL